MRSMSDTLSLSTGKNVVAFLILEHFADVLL